MQIQCSQSPGHNIILMQGLVSTETMRNYGAS